MNDSQHLTNAKVDVCVSIISGGDKQVAIDCLKSVINSIRSLERVEIWFTDNAAPQDWFSEISALSPLIHVVRNERRKGFGANHNAVMKNVVAKYYLLLNDDTIAYANFVEPLVAAAEKDPKVGFVGPRILNLDGTVQTSVYRFPSPRRHLFEVLSLHRLGERFPQFDDYRNYNYETEKLVDFLSGAALLIKRDVCDSVGLFDESFFMYSEETDWCMRAAEAGWQCLIQPKSEVMHYGGHSTIQYRAARSAEFYRSHAILIEKHFGVGGLRIYKMLNFLKHAPRALFAHLSNWPEHRRLAEIDATLWSIGLLKRAGLREQMSK